MPCHVQQARVPYKSNQSNLSRERDGGGESEQASGRPTSTRGLAVPRGGHAVPRGGHAVPRGGQVGLTLRAYLFMSRWTNSHPLCDAVLALLLLRLFHKFRGAASYAETL